MTCTRTYSRFMYSQNRLNMNRIPYSFVASRIQHVGCAPRTPPGSICVPPGAICVPSGAICVPPGAICAPPDAICVSPGSICVESLLFKCMYVKIRRHQHTRVHAHTGPRRHARAPACRRHHIPRLVRRQAFHTDHYR